MNDDRAEPVWSIPVDASLQEVLDRPNSPPLLQRALQGTVAWQTRNETSIERELTAPRIAVRWVAALLALGATVTVEGEEGSVEISLANVLERRPEGKMKSLNVSIAANLRWGEAQVTRTPTDEPIVAAIAAVEMDESSDQVVEQAHLALVGVWPRPVRLAEAASQLAGSALDESHIQAVAQAVEEEVEPNGDFRGSEEYRRAMAGVLTRRALERCLG